MVVPIDCLKRDEVHPIEDKTSKFATMGRVQRIAKDACFSMECPQRARTKTGLLEAQKMGLMSSQVVKDFCGVLDCGPHIPTHDAQLSARVEVDDLGPRLSKARCCGWPGQLQ